MELKFMLVKVAILLVFLMEFCANNHIAIVAGRLIIPTLTMISHSKASSNDNGYAINRHDRNHKALNKIPKQQAPKAPKECPPSWCHKKAKGRFQYIESCICY
ncbi:hypothetical protein AAHE18_17G188700 [Arachis hypogaea]|nr:uncharacterized protein DS421_17g594230 [Arachis hypogaea]